MFTCRRCTRMFMAVLLIIAEDWKQLTCPSQWENSINVVHPYHQTSVQSLKRIWAFSMLIYEVTKEMYVHLRKKECMYLRLEGATRNNHTAFELGSWMDDKKERERYRPYTRSLFSTFWILNSIYVFCSFKKSAKKRLQNCSRRVWKTWDCWNMGF